MATNRITMKAAPETVFAVLADARTYEHWLVGCKKVRDVDPGWPAPGTRFHHRVGIVGPLTLEDSTKSVEAEPPHRLVLEARARPAGVARVQFDITDDGAGGCQVVMHEAPVSGPAKLLHNRLLDALVSARNAKSLQRLRDLIEAGTTAPATDATG